MAILHAQAAYLVDVGADLAVTSEAHRTRPTPVAAGRVEAVHPTEAGVVTAPDHTDAAALEGPITCRVECNI